MTRPDDTDRLFEAARGALDPPEGARERVLAGVVGAGPGGPGGGGHPGGAGGAPSFGVVAAKVAGATAVAAALVGGALLAGGAFSRQRAPQQEPASAMVVAPAPPPSLLAPVATPPVTAPSEAIDLDVDAARVPRRGPAAAPAARPPVPAASSRADRLAEEIALLRQAQAALRSGNPSRSLSLLDQHARRFPHGVLSQESTVTRVQALCALGRTGEARALYARLAGASPDSPHLAALRHACPALGSE